MCDAWEARAQNNKAWCPVMSAGGCDMSSVKNCDSYTEGCDVWRTLANVATKEPDISNNCNFMRQAQCQGIPTKCGGPDPRCEVWKNMIDVTKEEAIYNAWCTVMKDNDCQNIPAKCPPPTTPPTTPPPTPPPEGDHNTNWIYLIIIVGALLAMGFMATMRSFLSTTKLQHFREV